MSSPGDFYRRRLPHWQPDGAPLFITWRLVGSLPHAPVGASSAAEAGRAFVRLDRQLDAAVTGPLWLKDPRIASLVAGSFSCAERELGLCEFRAWVLMPNHVHVVVYPSAPLWRITKALKGFTGKQANRILGRAGDNHSGSLSPSTTGSGTATNSSASSDT